jgi:hypothetical protein
VSVTWQASIPAPGRAAVVSSVDVSSSVAVSLLPPHALTMSANAAIARTADFLPLCFVIYLPFFAYTPMIYALRDTLVHLATKKNEQ